MPDLFSPIPNSPLPLDADPYLGPFAEHLHRRKMAVHDRVLTLSGGDGDVLGPMSSGHEYFGLHRQGDAWVMREWAPNAREVFLLHPGSGWRPEEAFRLTRLEGGQWEGRFPAEALHHEMPYRLLIRWADGEGDRIPAYARRVVQDPDNGIFNAQVWYPDEPYVWRHESPPRPDAALIYESHVGMAVEEPRVGTFAEFRRDMLPRIVAAGYNTIQLMAIQEHPYYGSFGYHVSNFFAVSSRFGTPDEFKALIDAAHGHGLRVIMDLVHSHAVRNEVEGLARFDGTPYQYFHHGERGLHPAWDSCCFDYGKAEVLHFLLSNCRFWLDEYHVDGFRFDGITSMLYHHHGLGHTFTDYEEYFSDTVDQDAVTYLALANRVVHAVRPDAVTVAEDVSGMPGLAAPAQDGGMGFDYRLAMGVTDMWFKMLDLPDEDWPLGHVWHELTNRRQDERTIAYVECHDQALVGGQTLIFRLLGPIMYDGMHKGGTNLERDRGIALHKMIRLATLMTAGHGYLTFMGNEFGHPEWIDFPREGNQWSYHHARRLWSLRDDPELVFHVLADFDQAMLKLPRETDFFRCRAQFLTVDEERRVLAFERAGLVAVFNFHPTLSHEFYPVEVLPGSYEEILDTDAPEFGGFGRLLAGHRHDTMLENSAGAKRAIMRLYLPTRTAIVLRRVALS